MLFNRSLPWLLRFFLFNFLFCVSAITTENQSSNRFPIDSKAASLQSERRKKHYLQKIYKFGIFKASKRGQKLESSGSTGPVVSAINQSNSRFRVVQFSWRNLLPFRPEPINRDFATRDCLMSTKPQTNSIEHLLKSNGIWRQFCVMIFIPEKKRKFIPRLDAGLMFITSL